MSPQASDLRIRPASRHHKAKRQPSPEEGPDGGHTQKASQEAGAGSHRDVCPRKNGTFGKE